MRRIGVLMNLAADDSEGQAAGSRLGRGPQCATQWGMSDAERSRKNATELVALTPDVLFATTFPKVAAAVT